MTEKESESSGVGKVRYHLKCAYHPDLDPVDSSEAAQKAAAEHIRTRHADASGVIATSAEVEIHPVLHFGTADLEKVKESEKPKVE